MSRRGCTFGIALALAIIFAGVGLLAASAYAQPPKASAEVRLPRHPALSPDGAEIAFSYQGDLWAVARAGGEARRLTAHVAYEGHPCWSPDGRYIAFASDRNGNNDVYILPVAGGAARRLTFNSYHDLPTGWTPDSRGVLFRSWRHVRDSDNPGIFLASLDGGTPAAVISSGGHDAVVSPDGTRLAFTRGDAYTWRRGYEGSARYQLWTYTMGEALRAGHPGGGPIGFAGRAPDWQVDEATSATTPGLQAIACLRPNGRFSDLDLLGRQPAWFPDGEHLLYWRERDREANLAIVRLRDGETWALTELDGDGRLRNPTLSANGRYAAFEYEDGLYTVEITPEFLSGERRGRPRPERVAIRIAYDLKAPEIEWRRVNSGARDFVLSPDGEQIAFVHQGEIFAMKASDEEPFAYNLTQSQARDWQPAWTPEGDTLVFVSDRDGDFDLYRAWSADPDDSRLARALEVEIEQLTDTIEEETLPRISPDGEWIAFLRGYQTLIVMAADGSESRVLAEGFLEGDHVWAPDSRWIAFSREDNDFNSDVWIVSVDGETGPINVSQHPDTDVAPAWSADGSALAFTSEREFLNQTDIWYVWLTEELEALSREERLDRFDQAASGGKQTGKQKTAAGAEEEGNGDAADGDEKAANDPDAGADDAEETAEEDLVVEIDFEGIHERLHRLTSFPGEETRVLINEQASEFYFVANAEGERDLWKIDWDGSDSKRLTHGGQNPQGVRWGSDEKQLYYLKSGGRIASVAASGGESTTYAFSAEQRIDRRAQRAYVFDEAWRLLRDKFYDPDMHGADWPAVRERFRPWALHASTYADFQQVLRWTMGELNASHLGTWDGPGDPDIRDEALASETGELGILIDPSASGPGVRIAHVVPDTPADQPESRLAAGERILTVNGTAIAAGDNLWRLLERMVGKPTRLRVAGQKGEERAVVIRPISGRELREKLYLEEVELRRRYVAERTDDRIAYIHIEGMNTTSLDLYERDLYAQAHGKEALIIDVRDNGGGWTTDLLLTSLAAADHATTIARGGGPGYPSHRRLLYAWTKPIAVLCDECSFSNAEIFSWAIQTIGRGPVIGQETHGGVISTGGTHLQDGSWLRLPFRGWYSKLDGSNMERTGCTPDHVVANPPGDLIHGRDPQLERAIAAALEQIED